MKRGNGRHYFQCILGVREGGWDLLMAEFSLVKWHRCLGWHTGDVHIIIGIGTWVMLIAIVYSAVIVVMMKIAQNGYWDYLLRISEVR